MVVVSVSQLKAHLSRYLREVRRGGEVQILDRGVPVARLVAVQGGAQEDDEPRRRLLADGIVRGGNGRTLEVLDQPPLELPITVSSALEEERADRV